MDNLARRYNNQANDARLERGNRLKEARERVGALELELHTLERAAQLRPGGEIIEPAIPRSESRPNTSRRGSYAGNWVTRLIGRRGEPAIR